MKNVNRPALALLLPILILLWGVSSSFGIGAAQTGSATGAEACKYCHADSYETYKTGKHGNKADPRTPANHGECAACHGDGAAHVKARGGKGAGGIANPGSKTLAPEAKNGICRTCHMDVGAQATKLSRHPVLEGKMACSDCHKVHGKKAKAHAK